MKLKTKWVLVAIVVAAILIFGIPLLINECFKHGGYITVCEAADILSYYGSVLSASIAVATLAITILFTRKQLQREAYQIKRKESWSKIVGVFTSTLKGINPIIPLKESIENGRAEPSAAIIIFQKYHLTCQTAIDELITYLDDSDYLTVEG